MRLFGLLGLAVIVACSPTPAPKHTEPNPQPLDIPPLAPPATATSKPIAAPAPVVADPNAPDEFDVARDPIAKRPLRDRALVVREAQTLEALLNATPATAPDRPALLMRNAQANLDLARMEQEPLDASHLRTKAIQYLLLIGLNTPNYNQLDEVYYLLGLSYEHNGDGASARKMYFELIQKRPNSKYIPYAYFGFGELFRREGAQDAFKFDLARQSYNEVLKYPQSDIRPFAQRRIDALPAR